MFAAEYAVRGRVCRTPSAAASWRRADLFRDPLTPMDAPAALAHRPPRPSLPTAQAAPSTRERVPRAMRPSWPRACPPGRHVLNACTDRYRFAVGFAACLMSRRVSLLPSTHTPEVIRQLAAFAPDAICLTDATRLRHRSAAVASTGCSRDLRPAGGRTFRVPQIPAEQLAAIVFTSGSTGAPLPYRKTLGPAGRAASRAGASRLGLLDGRARTSIGTVPAQHMYGLESTVLLALQSGNAFMRRAALLPRGHLRRLRRRRGPRVWITTPGAFAHAARRRLSPCRRSI